MVGSDPEWLPRQPPSNLCCDPVLSRKYINLAYVPDSLNGEKTMRVTESGAMHEAVRKRGYLPLAQQFIGFVTCPGNGKSVF